MNFHYDFIDWVGGFSIEVATPKEVLLFSKKYMLEVTNQYLTNGSGCNEYILKNQLKSSNLILFLLVFHRKLYSIQKMGDHQEH